MGVLSLAVFGGGDSSDIVVGAEVTVHHIEDASFLILLIGFFFDYRRTLLLLQVSSTQLVLYRLENLLLQPDAVAVAEGRRLRNQMDGTFEVGEVLPDQLLKHLLRVFFAGVVELWDTADRVDLFVEVEE